MSPRPSPPTGRLDALDGVRALAILVVMGFHSGLPGVGVGGFYGQDAFFVLSGFLITLLLLAEWQNRRTIGLRAFWGRRARRLLPALLAMLLTVDLYVSYVAPPGSYPRFKGDVLATLLYAANWHFVTAGADYFATTGAPSLLTHTWSLAIEEQFYLVWPLVVLAVLRLSRARPAAGRRSLLVITLGGAVLSAGWMAYAYRRGASPSRLYYGTDTHAQCLLVGAGLATALHTITLRRGQTGLVPQAHTVRVRRLIGIGAAGGAVGLLLMWTQVASTDHFAFEGGFLCVAICTALVLVAVCSPVSVAARLLSWRPLAYLGRISYGMYLWYFPLFAFVTYQRTGLQGWSLFTLRALADIAVASVSFHLLERPIQRSPVFRMSATVKFGAIRPLGITAVTLVGTMGVVIATLHTDPQPPAVAPNGRAVSAAGAAPGPPLRVLVIGDSTGLTLGASLGDPELDRAYNLVVVNEALIGCGVALSEQVRAHGTLETMVAPCDPASPSSEQWPARLRRDVATYQPDVVLVVAGRWEVFDRRNSASAPWENITQPGDAAYVRAALATAVEIGSGDGAHVALATSACFATGEQPDGRPWPEDSATRVDAYNAAVRQTAAQYRPTASVVDLHALVCPDGQFHLTVDGVTVRTADGIHYPFSNRLNPNGNPPAEAAAFGRWLAERIFPPMISARRQTEAPSRLASQG